MAHDLQKRMESGGNIQRNMEPTTLSQQIQLMEKQFQLAMPQGAEAAQLVRDALTCLRQNPLLARCSAASVLGGLMTCAQLGLRPGVLGHAWLIPYRNNRTEGYEAQLVIGYQGLVELAHRSGQIKSLIARTVYENDEFDVDYGLIDRLVHKPCLSGDKGRVIAYYAIAKFITGGHAFYVMSHDEMQVYREKNVPQGGKRGPWVDHFEQMAHKTCVRQLARWMPKSTNLARGLAADESVRVDTTPSAIDYPIHRDHMQLDSGPTEQENADTDVSAHTQQDSDA